MSCDISQDTQVTREHMPLVQSHWLSHGSLPSSLPVQGHAVMCCAEAQYVCVYVSQVDPLCFRVLASQLTKAPGGREGLACQTRYS